MFFFCLVRGVWQEVGGRSQNLGILSLQIGGRCHSIIVVLNIISCKMFINIYIYINLYYFVFSMQPVFAPSFGVSPLDFGKVGVRLPPQPMFWAYVPIRVTKT